MGASCDTGNVTIRARRSTIGSRISKTLAVIYKKWHSTLSQLANDHLLLPAPFLFIVYFVWMYFFLLMLPFW